VGVTFLLHLFYRYAVTVIYTSAVHC